MAGTQASPSSPEPQHTGRPSQEELRKAIDLVATLRARAVRVGLFSALLAWPAATDTTSQKDRQTYLDILKTEVGMIGTVCATLARSGPLPDTDARHCEWIQQTARSMPKELRDVLEIQRLSETLLESVLSSSTDLQIDLKNQMDKTRGTFFASVTAICDALWHDLYASQAEDLERASMAAQSLNKRLERLAYIGKHVRLVSLNASVEAARIGETGKGVMVIAHEFKALAEEIQHLARDAHVDANQIS